jgi:alkylhydroperoxidase family enzyme
MALGDGELTRRVLDDFETAPIDERLKTTLRFLRKLVHEPEAVSAADIRPMLAAGVSKEAAADAVYVCFLFSIYTRLADTLGWALLDDAGYQASGRHLLKRGYL